MSSAFEVVAGETLLAGYVRTPLVGLTELIWNAFDEDAVNVRVSYEQNALGAIDRVHVDDDGTGMTPEGAQRAFKFVGDSWKRQKGVKTQRDGRAVNGRQGRGRYTAFSLGEAVTWTTVADSDIHDDRLRTKISGFRDTLKRFELSEPESTTEPLGTHVTAINPTPLAQRDLLNDDAVRNRLLVTFALHLEQYPELSLTWQGGRIDPAAMQTTRSEFVVANPDGTSGTIEMTFIEWNLKNVDRRIYLCDASGTVLHDVPVRVHAPGIEFSVYLRWDGFRKGEHDLELIEHGESPARSVLEAAKVELKRHFDELSGARERAIIARWKGEDVYPYRVEPNNIVETVERQAFNVVAIAAASVVNKSKSAEPKRLSLALIREALETNPNSLHRVLTDVLSLAPERVEELQALLERTTLSSVISASKHIADRLDFIQGLNGLIFDKETKKQTLERRQLHRILANETWIFGEEWALTGDDDRLIKVLREHLSMLGEDAELADPASVKRVDGSDAIPDLVLSKTLTTGENKFEHLVVELKRPSHTLRGEDVEQLRSYAGAISRNERFQQPNVHWDFWLIGNSVNDDVEEQRVQVNLPHGVVTQTQKYSVRVKTWAEVLGDADHRHKFVRESLAYTTTHDDGIRYLQRRHSEYLPPAIEIEERGEEIVVAG